MWKILYCVIGADMGDTYFTWGIPSCVIWAVSNKITWETPSCIKWVLPYYIIQTITLMLRHYLTALLEISLRRPQEILIHIYMGVTLLCCAERYIVALHERQLIELYRRYLTVLYGKSHYCMGNTPRRVTWGWPLAMQNLHRTNTQMNISNGVKTYIMIPSTPRGVLKQCWCSLVFAGKQCSVGQQQGRCKS